jgi:hypothetical protein
MARDEWERQAGRLRDVARDPAVRAYLLGRFCAELGAAELANLVQAALSYRERFGAAGNYRRASSAEVVSRQLDHDEAQAWIDGGREASGQRQLDDL